MRSTFDGGLSAGRFAGETTKMSQTIYLASDHAGFHLKEKIKARLAEEGTRVEDCGALSYEPGDDYPDFIFAAAEKVAASRGGAKAVVLGGSGQGEAMAANRLKGVRAAVVYSFNEEIIRLSREHNDANVLSLGARFLDDADALKAVDLWLKTGFSGDERHRRRIAKLDRK